MRGPRRRLRRVDPRPRPDRLAARAALAERRVDREHSHVALVDPAACRACPPDPCCTFLCPAGVFVPAPAGGSGVAVRHERCVECGACRLFCPADNIRLEYPRGGFGLFHRYG